MVKEYSRHLLVIALGFVAGLLVFFEVFGPYLQWDGERGEPYSARILTLFGLPATASAIVLLVRSLQRRPTGGSPTETADAAVRSIVFWVVCFLVGVHALLLAVLLQIEGILPLASRAVIVLLGVTLIGVGNLLPRTRPNMAFGIRTTRTLADRRLWMITHRTSGYVVVAIGVVTILSGLLEDGVQIAQWPVLACAAGAIVLLVTYRRVARVRS